MSLAVAPDLIAAGEFDLDAYLSVFDERLLDDPEGRRVCTRLDPLLFALCYLPHHLRSPDTDDLITLSDFHLDIIGAARGWVVPNDAPRQGRDAYVAPRGCGKTTWFFLILPMWAAAHGHRRFIAAFADTAAQAELHLQTFKQELQRNRLLRADYPDLCRAAKRPTGHAVSDTRQLYIAESRFAFAARGVDTANLGLKVEDRRPDLIILDDIEPPEEHYSGYLKDQRLGTLTDAILPLSEYARVVLVGTVTMYGSIVHDLVRSITQPDHAEAWIADEKFVAHYYPAIVADPTTGQRRSIWPAKWSLAFLESIEHTRSFKKNYNNDPMGAAGKFWVEGDFVFGTLEVITHQLISIDPAVTTRGTSDYTALVVIAAGFRLQAGQAQNLGPRTCMVRDALNLRISPGAELVAAVQRLRERWPGVAGILVESNQGGDVWKGVLGPTGLPVRTIHNKAPKPVRAARLLRHYQAGRVVHERELAAVQGQMVSFPLGAFDDLVDAVGTGVGVFLDPVKSKRPGVRSQNYL